MDFEGHKKWPTPSMARAAVYLVVIGMMTRLSIMRAERYGQLGCWSNIGLETDPRWEGEYAWPDVRFYVKNKIWYSYLELEINDHLPDDRFTADTQLLTEMRKVPSATWSSNWICIELADLMRLWLPVGEMVEVESSRVHLGYIWIYSIIQT